MTNSIHSKQGNWSYQESGSMPTKGSRFTLYDGICIGYSLLIDLVEATKRCIQKVFSSNDLKTAGTSGAKLSTFNVKDLTCHREDVSDTSITDIDVSLDSWQSDEPLEFPQQPSYSPDSPHQMLHNSTPSWLKESSTDQINREIGAPSWVLNEPKPSTVSKPSSVFQRVNEYFFGNNTDTPLSLIEDEINSLIRL